jgi:hypothetical protein
MKARELPGIINQFTLQPLLSQCIHWNLAVACDSRDFRAFGTYKYGLRPIGKIFEFKSLCYRMSSESIAKAQSVA